MILTSSLIPNFICFCCVSPGAILALEWLQIKMDAFMLSPILRSWECHVASGAGKWLFSRVLIFMTFFICDCSKFLRTNCTGIRLRIAMKTLMLVSVELCGEGLEIYQTHKWIFTGVYPFVLYELKVCAKCPGTKSTITSPVVAWWGIFWKRIDTG